MNISPTRYIVVAAIEDETPGIETYAPVVHTGVGKLNAAIGVYEAIQHYRPELVINYGLAGSVAGLNGLHQVDTFIERDMDARPLGVDKGVVPFSNESLPTIHGVVLGSGDSFVTDTDAALEGFDFTFDLVDMEGYALYKVCKRLEVAFKCYKFVSDKADDSAADTWENQFEEGAQEFTRLLAQQYSRSLLIEEPLG